MSIRDGSKRTKQLADRMSAIRGLVPMPENERSGFDIKSVRADGYIRFGGCDYLVEGISRYDEHNWKLTKSKNFNVYELDLLCLDTGERSNIEWEVDDKVEVSITSAEIKMSQLTDDERAGIDKGDLQQILNDEDSVFLAGKEYLFEEGWAAMYYRDCGGTGVRVRFYEFESRDGQTLTIEEWIDGPLGDPDTEHECEVFLAKALDSDDIEVLNLGRKE